MIGVCRPQNRMRPPPGPLRCGGGPPGMDGRTTACDAGASGKGFLRHSGNFRHAVGTVGGRGELLFDEHALDEWLAAQADLDPPERFDLASLGLAADEWITLGRFAWLIGLARATVTHIVAIRFSIGGADGTYRAGELLDYWNSRTGYRSQAPKRGAAS